MIKIFSKSKDQFEFTKGVLTLGGKPDDCSSEWVTQPLVKNKYDQDVIIAKK